MQTLGIQHAFSSFIWLCGPITGFVVSILFHTLYGSIGLYYSSVLFNDYEKALALEEAVRYALQIGITDCVFETDNKSIAEAIMAMKPPLQVDWRAFKQVFKVWKWFRGNQGLKCDHISRSHNEVADCLAKRGTHEKWDLETHTFPLMSL